MATTAEWALQNDFVAADPLPEAWVNAVANDLEYTRWGWSSLAMADANQDVADDEDRATLLKLTGALTAGRNLTVRTTAGGGFWFVWNATTGGFAVTVKTAAGGGVAIPAGYRAVLGCDGTDVILLAPLLPVSPAAYTPTNVTTDRAYDANATTLDEVADVLGTLIADLKAAKVIG